MFSMRRLLTSKDDIAAVVRSLDRPVNVLMGLQGIQLSLASLSDWGLNASALAARSPEPHSALFFAQRGKCEKPAPSLLPMTL